TVAGTDNTGRRRSHLDAKEPRPHEGDGAPSGRRAHHHHSRKRAPPRPRLSAATNLLGGGRRRRRSGHAPWGHAPGSSTTSLASGPPGRNSRRTHTRRAP